MSKKNKKNLDNNLINSENSSLNSSSNNQKENLRSKKKSLNESLESKNTNSDDNKIEINQTYFKRDVLELPKQKLISEIKPKKSINTNLSLNIKVYNKFIDYLPSDFTPKMVKNLFISNKKSHFPKDTKITVELQPNDVECNLKVIVSIDKYYKNSNLVNEQMIFKPFWIIGFKTYSLLVSEQRPLESLYRINNIHDFSYQESQKIIRKKISSKKHDVTKSNYQNESDFLRARELKNWYIEQYISRLNKMPNLTWECVPVIKLNKSTKTLYIKLYVQIDQVKNAIKHTKRVYADSFSVKLANLLDYAKSKEKVVDIDTIMYLIALNATYKNVKIFYYDTLYTIYKLLCAKLLSNGYTLKDISANNLATLKIIDFSRHYFCKQKMFNDRILHIMNLVSADEQYYQMKYAFTIQKNPNLLYSDFILTEFKTNVVNELSTIIKNLENEYWNEKIKDIQRLSNGDVTPDKQFYINNYNVLDVTNNNYKTVEEFLMGTIKENKDEIARLSKLGEEILAVDERKKFTNSEIKDLKRATKKMDDNYKEIFEKSKKSKKKKDDKLYL